MFRAPTRSRWHRCPQCGQEKQRPLGLGTDLWHSGQVEDVPRSFTSTTLMPASSALSDRHPSRWVRRQLRSARFWRCPQSLVVMPLGSPTTTVPTWWFTSHATTDLAASWWAWRTLRRWRASALLRAARWRRQRRLPLWARDEETLLACQHGIGVDDAEVDPGDDAGIRLSALDRNRDLGRHVEKEPSRLGDEGDRADRLDREGDRPAQAHPQLGGTPGDAEADPGPVEAEAPPAEANRDKAPLAAGKAGPDTGLLAPGRLEEGGRVALQHILCAVAGQLPEARARELPAQSLEVGHLGAVPFAKLTVAVDHPGPCIPGAVQQAVAASALGRGGAQGDPGGAVDLPSGTHVRKDREGYRQESGLSKPRKICSVAQTRSGPSNLA
jgi:hypothetical protein